MAHALGVPAGRTARPLLVTADTELLDEVLRVSAAAGVELEVVPDPGAARRLWASAPLVLVGDDCAITLANAALPRRDALVLVGKDVDDASVWQRGVQIGAADVVFVPDGAEWLAGRLSVAADGNPRDAALIGVVGGRGGAGASTLAAALAVTGTRRGLACLLVDADPLGGGLDLVLGYEDAAGMRWPQLAGARGRIGAETLHDVLPSAATPGRPGAGLRPLPLVSCDRGGPLEVPPAEMGTILDCGARAADLVVVDLPRHRTEASDIALARTGLVLVVVPAEVRAVAAADQVVRLVAAVASDVRIVVRTPRRSDLAPTLIADSMGVRLAGQMPPDPGLDAALERGLAPARAGRGPLATLCHQLIDAHVVRPVEGG